ncbi:acyl-CoA N-acyltransferase, partial [Agrocybe pediades]
MQEPSPGRKTSEIRVRPFQASDLDTVQEMFLASMVNQSDSPFAKAMKGQLTAPLSWASYAAFAAGLIVRRRYSKRIGVSLSLLGSIIFAVHRIVLYIGLRRRVERNLKADLADISGHYGMKEVADRNIGAVRYTPSGKSGFWIAEVWSEGREPEAIGCVGLDANTNADPTSAELRRMSVISSYRRKGVALLLVRALMEHSREKGIKTVFFSTSSFQEGAMKMYQRYGWKYQ